MHLRVVGTFDGAQLLQNARHDLRILFACVGLPDQRILPVEDKSDLLGIGVQVHFGRVDVQHKRPVGLLAVEGQLHDDGMRRFPFIVRAGQRVRPKNALVGRHDLFPGGRIRRIIQRAQTKHRLHDLVLLGHIQISLVNQRIAVFDKIKRIAELLRFFELVHEVRVGQGRFQYRVRHHVYGILDKLGKLLIDLPRRLPYTYIFYFFSYGRARSG
ncbi:hypothetical protein CM49_04516 [Paenibacillus sp. P1XP2]|nr:hypothetical protein CM49_04516 [Paenibacillus sp. P1XP2]